MKLNKTLEVLRDYKDQDALYALAYKRMTTCNTNIYYSQGRILCVAEGNVR